MYELSPANIRTSVVIENITNYVSLHSVRSHHISRKYPYIG